MNYHFTRTPPTSRDIDFFGVKAEKRLGVPNRGLRRNIGKARPILPDVLRTSDPMQQFRNYSR
jgi:hypothetical protein